MTILSLINLKELSSRLQKLIQLLNPKKKLVNTKKTSQPLPKNHKSLTMPLKKFPKLQFVLCQQTTRRLTLFSTKKKKTKKRLQFAQEIARHQVLLTSQSLSVRPTAEQLLSLIATVQEKVKIIFQNQQPNSYSIIFFTRRLRIKQSDCLRISSQAQTKNCSIIKKISLFETQLER